MPNVWLGVSVEDQRRVNERIPLLLDTPAAVRFLSVEPLLGPITLRRIACDPPCRIDARDRYEGSDGLNWVIAGGESGPEARPMHADWVRLLRDQCQAAGVPFFFKQWGGPTAKAGGRLLDGVEHNDMPADLEREAEQVWGASHA